MIFYLHGLGLDLQFLNSLDWILLARCYGRGGGFLDGRHFGGGEILGGMIQ